MIAAMRSFLLRAVARPLLIADCQKSELIPEESFVSGKRFAGYGIKCDRPKAVMQRYVAFGFQKD